MNTAINFYSEDNLEALKKIAPSSIDSMVTDPPAGINMPMADWDDDKGSPEQWIYWLTEVFKECKNVLKPGAHGLVWAFPRTSHRTAIALESAGFEIRDVVTHLFGSGFPKGQSASKAIKTSKTMNRKRILGVTAWIRKRKIRLGLTDDQIDSRLNTKGSSAHWTSNGKQAFIPTLDKWKKLTEILGPAPKKIERSVIEHHTGGVNGLKTQNKLVPKFEDWGTKLKPASEHWILVRKPLDQNNLALNLLEHGTGALNIDASRIKLGKCVRPKHSSDFTRSGFFAINNCKTKSPSLPFTPNPKGRHPTNVVISRDSKGSPLLNLNRGKQDDPDIFFHNIKDRPSGLYCSKPSKKERGVFNDHPTVKPVQLMEYFVNMVTPSKGRVLDPFMGSGTTGVAAVRNGFQFTGIDSKTSYVEIAQRRIDECNHREG